MEPQPKPQVPLTEWQRVWLWTIFVGSILGIPACVYVVMYFPAVVAPFTLLDTLVFAVNAAIAAVGIWPGRRIYRFEDASYQAYELAWKVFVAAMLVLAGNVALGSL